MLSLKELKAQLATTGQAVVAEAEKTVLGFISKLSKQGATTLSNGEYTEMGWYFVASESDLFVEIVPELPCTFCGKEASALEILQDYEVSGELTRGLNPYIQIKGELLGLDGLVKANKGTKFTWAVETEADSAPVGAGMTKASFCAQQLHYIPQRRAQRRDMVSWRNGGRAAAAAESRAASAVTVTERGPF
jgi:hypothetical protein